MTDEIVTERRSGVAWLRFARPDLGNALTPAQAAALLATLESLDDTVRVVVLTGSGTTFNVGARRRAPGEARPDDPAAAYRAQIPVMLRVVELLTDPRWVTIAAVNGGCAGAGLALALACDLRYACDTARFNTGFLAAGLPGELGAVWFAQRLVGTGRAKELFLLPERTDAARLADIGLLNGVLPAGELAAAVDAVADRIAASPAAAVRVLKADFERAASLPLKQYLPTELDGMSECLTETTENGDGQ